MQRIIALGLIAIAALGCSKDEEEAAPSVLGQPTTTAGPAGAAPPAAGQGAQGTAGQPAQGAGQAGTGAKVGSGQTVLTPDAPAMPTAMPSGWATAMPSGFPTAMPSGMPSGWPTAMPTSITIPTSIPIPPMPAPTTTTK
ncbi:MAG TPA: hypothetical protein VE093_40395 [Polyangiaceae bacterium]|nr:hypothetical protein [Polyangiaceae bacterium]